PTASHLGTSLIPPLDTSSILLSSWLSTYLKERSSINFSSLSLFIEFKLKELLEQTSSTALGGKDGGCTMSEHTSNNHLDVFTLSSMRTAVLIDLFDLIIYNIHEKLEINEKL